jgi:hypothetical protein
MRTTGGRGEVGKIGGGGVGKRGKWIGARGGLNFEQGSGPEERMSMGVSGGGAGGVEGGKEEY